jgi:hypothetical protein
MTEVIRSQPEDASYEEIMRELAHYETPTLLTVAAAES